MTVSIPNGAWEAGMYCPGTNCGWGQKWEFPIKMKTGITACSSVLWLKTSPISEFLLDFILQEKTLFSITYFPWLFSIYYIISITKWFIHFYLLCASRYMTAVWCLRPFQILLFIFAHMPVQLDLRMLIEAPCLNFVFILKHCLDLKMKILRIYRLTIRRLLELEGIFIHG